MNFKTLLFVFLVLVAGSFLSSALLDIPSGVFAQDAGADTSAGDAKTANGLIKRDPFLECR